MDKNKIVPDGPQRIKETEEYKQQVGEIRSAIRAKYAVEHEQANLLTRWLLELKIRREVSREIKQLAPDDALYLKT